MAIKHVRAVSRPMMSLLLKGGPGMYDPPAPSAYHELIGAVALYDRCWIISIRDLSKEPLAGLSKDDLSLEFEDFEPGDPLLGGFEFEPGCMFNDTQADQVRAFLKNAHAQPGNDILVCNCHMGISRSGAIVTYATEVAGLPLRMAKVWNPQINPNEWVLSQLRKKA